MNNGTNADTKVTLRRDKISPTTRLRQSPAMIVVVRVATLNAQSRQLRTSNLRHATVIFTRSQLLTMTAPNTAPITISQSEQPVMVAL